jgi:hypothetical protein
MWMRCVVARLGIERRNLDAACFAAERMTTRGCLSDTVVRMARTLRYQRQRKGDGEGPQLNKHTGRQL